MSDAPNVTYEQRDAIATVRLNRPELHNALIPELVTELVDILTRVNTDYSVSAIVITGVGSSFSSGGNVKNMSNWNAQGSKPLQTRDWYNNGIQRLPRAMNACDVPIIAAVNGAAVGAGCDLSCMCDVRIAARSARFAERFVKLGLIPGDGGAWFLPRVVGRSKAREMAFTGDFIDAEEALRYGLVSKVVDDAQLMDASLALAARIACNPPHAVRMAKRLMRDAEQVGLDTALQLSASMQALAHATSDHQEAAQAFLEKRPPHFVGN